MPFVPLKVNGNSGDLQKHNGPPCRNTSASARYGSLARKLEPTYLIKHDYPASVEEICIQGTFSFDRGLALA